MTLLKSAELQGSHDNNEHLSFVPSRLNLNHSRREATFYRILEVHEQGTSLRGEVMCAVRRREKRLEALQV